MNEYNEFADPSVSSNTAMQHIPLQTSKTRKRSSLSSSTSTSSSQPSPSSSSSAASAAAASSRSAVHREVLEAVSQLQSHSSSSNPSAKVEQLMQQTMEKYEKMIVNNGGGNEKKSSSASNNNNNITITPLSSQPQSLPSSSPPLLSSFSSLHSQSQNPNQHDLTSIRSLHTSVQSTLSSIQNKTSRILKDQERDLLRSFRTRLFEVTEELEYERKKNENGSVEWVGRCKKLTEELDWLRELIMKLSSENKALLNENRRTQRTIVTQDQDRSFLIQQLVEVKKENAKLRFVVEQQLQKSQQVHAQMQQQQQQLTPNEQPQLLLTSPSDSPPQTAGSTTTINMRQLLMSSAPSSTADPQQQQQQNMTPRLHNASASSGTNTPRIGSASSSSAAGGGIAIPKLKFQSIGGVVNQALAQQQQQQQQLSHREHQQHSSLPHTPSTTLNHFPLPPSNLRASLAAAATTDSLIHSSGNSGMSSLAGSRPQTTANIGGSASQAATANSNIISRPQTTSSIMHTSAADPSSSSSSRYTTSLLPSTPLTSSEERRLKSIISKLKRQVQELQVKYQVNKQAYENEVAQRNALQGLWRKCVEVGVKEAEGKRLQQQNQQQPGSARKGIKAQQQQPSPPTYNLIPSPPFQSVITTQPPVGYDPRLSHHHHQQQQQSTAFSTPQQKYSLLQWFLGHAPVLEFLYDAIFPMEIQERSYKEMVNGGVGGGGETSREMEGMLIPIGTSGGIVVDNEGHIKLHRDQQHHDRHQFADEFKEE